MTYAAMSTVELKQVEQTARAAITDGEANGASRSVMKARYGVLGAVSAVLATRKPEVRSGCGFCLGGYEACPACFQ